MMFKKSTRRNVHRALKPRLQSYIDDVNARKKRLPLKWKIENAFHELKKLKKVQMRSRYLLANKSGKKGKTSSFKHYKAGGNSNAIYVLKHPRNLKKIRRKFSYKKASSGKLLKQKHEKFIK